MLIPEKVYEKIPIAYFIVGVLLIINAFYKGMDDLTAYLHFFFGSMSVLYAVSVHQARAKYRKNLPKEESQQSQSDVRDLS